MDDIGKLITAYGVPVAIVVILINQLVNLVSTSGPKTIEWWQNRSQDEQEHRQKRELGQDKVKQLEYLSVMGSRTFIEDQLTEMASSQQIEAQTANEFIRKDLAARQDILAEKISLLSNKIDKLPKEVREDIQKDFKDVLNEISQNWQMMIFEQRNTQAKISVMTELFKEIINERGGGSQQPEAVNSK